MNWLDWILIAKYYCAQRVEPDRSYCRAVIELSIVERHTRYHGVMSIIRQFHDEGCSTVALAKWIRAQFEHLRCCWQTRAQQQQHSNSVQDDPHRTTVNLVLPTRMP